MTEKDCLKDILETEKNLSVNMSIALNEASQKELYKKLLKMFEEINKQAKELFAIAYNNNWYQLEDADSNKTSKELKKLKQELS